MFANPFPSLSSYVLTRVIGTGSYATVYEACPKTGRTDERVAIKMLAKSNISADGQHPRYLSEIEVMRQLTSPSPPAEVGLPAIPRPRPLGYHHVVRLLETIEDEHFVYLVLECCRGGDLRGLIQGRGRLSEPEVAFLIRQVGLGLQFLRERSLIHRDLKPQNLLLYEEQTLATSVFDMTVKIADFGLARTLSDSDLASTCVGSPLYMSPEVLRGSKYNTKADLWSVGVITYELLVGTTPWVARSPAALLAKIINEPAKIPDSLGLSDTCIDFLQSLLIPNPRSRSDFSHFVDHPFLANSPVLRKDEIILGPAESPVSLPRTKSLHTLIAARSMPVLAIQNEASNPQQLTQKPKPTSPPTHPRGVTNILAVHLLEKAQTQTPGKAFALCLLALRSLDSDLLASQPETRERVSEYAAKAWKALCSADALQLVEWPVEVGREVLAVALDLLRNSEVSAVVADNERYCAFKLAARTLLNLVHFDTKPAVLEQFWPESEETDGLEACLDQFDLNL